MYKVQVQLFVNYVRALVCGAQSLSHTLTFLCDGRALFEINISTAQV